MLIGSSFCLFALAVQPPRCFPVLTLTALGFVVAAFCMSLFSAITPGWHADGSTNTGQHSQQPGGWDLPQEAWLYATCVPSPLLW